MDFIARKFLGILLISLSVLMLPKELLSKSSKDRIAVLAFEGQDLKKNQKWFSDLLQQKMTEHFATLGKPRLKVVERAFLKEILNEKALSQMEGSEEEQVEKLFSANLIVSGSLSKKGKKLLVSSRLLAVRTGDIISSKTVELFPKKLAKFGEEFVAESLSALGISFKRKRFPKIRLSFPQEALFIKGLNFFDQGNYSQAAKNLCKLARFKSNWLTANTTCLYALQKTAQKPSLQKRIMKKLEKVFRKDPLSLSMAGKIALINGFHKSDQHHKEKNILKSVFKSGEIGVGFLKALKDVSHLVHSNREFLKIFLKAKSYIDNEYSSAHRIRKLAFDRMATLLYNKGSYKQVVALASRQKRLSPSAGIYYLSSLAFIRRPGLKKQFMRHQHIFQEESYKLPLEAELLCLMVKGFPTRNWDKEHCMNNLQDKLSSSTNKMQSFITFKAFSKLKGARVSNDLKSLFESEKSQWKEEVLEEFKNLPRSFKARLTLLSGTKRKAKKVMVGDGSYIFFASNCVICEAFLKSAKKPLKNFNGAYFIASKKPVVPDFFDPNGQEIFFDKSMRFAKRILKIGSGKSLSFPLLVHKKGNTIYIQRYKNGPGYSVKVFMEINSLIFEN